MKEKGTPAPKIKKKLISGMCSTYGEYTGKVIDKPHECMMDLLDGFISDDEELEDIYVPYQHIGRFPQREVSTQQGTVFLVNRKDVMNVVALENAKKPSLAKKPKKKKSTYRKKTKRALTAPPRRRQL